jgi:hypothetical protein
MAAGNGHPGKCDGERDGRAGEEASRERIISAILLYARLTGICRIDKVSDYDVSGNHSDRSIDRTFNARYAISYDVTVTQD